MDEKERKILKKFDEFHVKMEKMSDQVRKFDGASTSSVVRTEVHRPA